MNNFRLLHFFVTREQEVVVSCCQLVFGRVCPSFCHLDLMWAALGRASRPTISYVIASFLQVCSFEIASLPQTSSSLISLISPSMPSSDAFLFWHLSPHGLWNTHAYINIPLFFTLFSPRCCLCSQPVPPQLISTLKVTEERRGASAACQPVLRVVCRSWWRAEPGGSAGVSRWVFFPVFCCTDRKLNGFLVTLMLFL